MHPASTVERVDGVRLAWQGDKTMTWPEWSLTDVLVRRPAVRVEQLGYLPGRPVRATLVSAATEPVPVALVDSGGCEVTRGWSAVWGQRPEATSGLSVHVIEVPGPAADGDGFWVRAGDAVSHPFSVRAGLHLSVARDALGVLTLLRSGTAIDDQYLGHRRPAGHVGVVPNTGDTSVPAWSGPDAERVYPGWRCEGRFDVSGGWYDAGDYGKYVTSGGIALWQLLGVLDCDSVDGRGADVEAVRQECRWQLDWMLRMQVPRRDPLAGMAFHRVHGTTWSPVPGWAHLDPTERVLHRPSTAATLHLAATAAQGARLFAVDEPAYAASLLAAARRAWQAAQHHPGILAPDDHALHGGGPYDDDDPSDDAYWAATQLWLTTGEDQYIDAVLASQWHRDDVLEPTLAELDGFDFNRVALPARLDLALNGAALPDHERVVDGVLTTARRLLDIAAHQPWGQPYAPPSGWGWGSNGRMLNNMVVLAVAHRLTRADRYFQGALDGLSHLLGRNALGQCYVTGYGTDASQHLRARQFGRDLDPAMPPVPPGAVAGGANSQPSPDFFYDPRLEGVAPQLCYLDEPTSEVTNDLCIRWNAPLVYLAHHLDLHADPTGH